MLQNSILLQYIMLKKCDGYTTSWSHIEPMTIAKSSYMATTWPRLYHVKSTFTKLPLSCSVMHGHDSTMSIPLSPNYHHLAASCMATTLPRQIHFRQTTTILQRHAWPRLYHVNSTFAKLPPSCSVMHGHDSTTSTPVAKLPFSCNIMIAALPRQCHFHLTATSWPRDNATSMPLSRNHHTLQCGNHVVS